MWNMVWPLGLVVICNNMYNICTKSTPEQANAFLSLSVTYLVAAALCIGAFILYDRGNGFTAEIKNINWTAIVLGIVCVGLEFGYICIYRAGWKVSAASMTGNICLACALVFIGALLYKETITLKQIIGMLVCIAGLFLVNG